MRPIPLISTSCLFLLLAACDTLPTRAAATPEPVADAPATVAPSGPAANDNLNAVAWMQTSVEFRLISGQTFRAALVQLDKAIKTPAWDALTREDRATPVTAGMSTAVIVDVDETVLDNSPYQARLIRDGKSFDEFTWSEWVREAAGRPVPGALEFVRAAAARGVKVYYLSNRAADLSADTVRNLRSAGFPITDDSQFLGLGTIVDGCESEGSEKGCRRQLIGRTHRVLMQFGDQLGDMVTIVANTPEGREQAARPYLGWVGERWFVLPNPSYGSWEPALFNNAWSDPENERRQKKINALRY